jgi:NAD(P)-dependent dehydrogenase (short-subunit alcohol dehydrogenase family)
VVYGNEIQNSNNPSFGLKMIDNIFSLKNKHVVITGATGLVGEVLVSALVDFAAVITLVGSNERKLDSLTHKFDEKKFTKINTYTLDLTSSEEVLKFLIFMESSNQRVDGVIHCAMYRPSQNSHECYEETFEASIYGNAVSSFLLWNGFSKMMGKRSGGSLVYISSIYGEVSPDFSIYEGTNMGTEPDYVFIKEGMSGLSKYYANKYGHLGVRSNVIILGGVSNNQPTLFTEKYIKKVPLMRMATPLDVVGACIYLLSDASSYVTGSEIRIDGGYLSR